MDRYFDCGTGWPAGARKVCDIVILCTMGGSVGRCDIDKAKEIRRPLWRPRKAAYFAQA